MNNLTGFPFTYTGISLFLSGFSVFAVIRLLSALKTGKNQFIPHFILTISAGLYIISNTLSEALSHYQPGSYLLILKELTPLLFLTAIPYMLTRAVKLSPLSVKINRFLFITGAVLTLLITFAVIFNPYFLSPESGLASPAIFIREVAAQTTSPVIIITDLITGIYIIYAILLLSHAIIHDKTYIPVKNILIAFAVLLYFTLTGFYILLFYKSNSGYVSAWYPHTSTGLALFILFINFSVSEIYKDYISGLTKNNAALEYELFNDPMVNIYNRKKFIHDIKIKLDQANNTGESFPLIFIDVDDFQDFNDSFGEKTGDQLLKLLTENLIENFSHEGGLYRIGGDDFAFILEKNQNETETKEVTKKIISSLRNPFPISGNSYLVSASLGILHIPDHGSDIDTIFDNAYSVIRKAKLTKNSFAEYSDDITDSSAKKINIINLLRNSISLDMFTLFYQPVVDCSGRMVYAESLLRCTNPDPAIEGPGHFIPLMEKAGLIKDIDDMVIRKAFYDMEMRIKKRFDISINLSTNQLLSSDYCEFLSAFAAQHSIEPEKITLEILENELIDNLEAGRKNLLKLKRKGFRIAIDDFGKGYSSLSYLSELPVDILKIDMAFVQTIPGDRKKEAIAEYIIKMAHSLGLHVVAEGFELKDQFEFFKKLGCDNFQGYYFSRPLPLDKLIEEYLK
jgi:diguanylate cyclase (GGDEF)-like protein